MMELDIFPNYDIWNYKYGTMMIMILTIIIMIIIVIIIMIVIVDISVNYSLKWRWFMLCFRVWKWDIQQPPRR